MGRVWVADQLALDRRVAVKVLSDEGIQSKPALELFHREARATARVDSPHVVRVLDFDVTEHAVPFLVLELLVGETLEERVLRMGALPLDDARAILEQTCHALAAAHGCGILHRDIKAENLFLQAGRRVDVKLLDFGIALMKHASGGPRQMGPVGTPQYMSPEQMLGHDVDERSDLFSLGVCIYHALTGAFPYPGNSCAEIGCALSKGTFLPPSAYRLGLSRGVDAWFEKAIAVRIEERFSSTSEMLEAFECAIAPSARDTPVSLELDLEGLHEGWPSAVWKAIGAVAALAAVAVTVHAGMVERRAARALAAVAETRTTSAVIAAKAMIPPPPPDEVIESASPAPASPPSKAIAAHPKKKARPHP